MEKLKDVEYEKKFVFAGNYASPFAGFKKVKQHLDLTNGKEIEMSDTYYDSNGILKSQRINLRRRIVDGQIEWTIKRPLNRISNISERVEKNFSSLEEALEFLKTNWHITLGNLTEVLILRTLRMKYDLKFKDTLIEIAFDKTIPVYNGHAYQANFMIECELKNGDDYYLEQIGNIILKEEGIVECKQSKKEIALSCIGSIHTDTRNLPASIFVHNEKLYAELKKLHAKKERIKELKDNGKTLAEPIVITVSGTPRAGKTTCVDNLFEFFKKADLKTVSLLEPAGIVYANLKSKAEKEELLKDRVGFVDLQYKIGNDAINEKLVGNDIIICDRGAIDPFIWYQMYFELGMMDEKRLHEFFNLLNSKKQYRDYFYALYADSNEALKRDYLNSLSIENRSTMNPENISRYNAAMLRLIPTFEALMAKTRLIDTSHLDRMDASILVANEVSDDIIRLLRSK